MSDTRIDEIASGIYRISTSVPPTAVPGGFTFNQFLIVDEAPLLFHTGHRRMFPAVRQAMEKVMPVERLRYVAFSHFESDECGALNKFLAVAPAAEPLCGWIGAMVSVNEAADRPAVSLRDGETVPLGKHVVRWIDAPQVPHGWDTGFLFEETTRTLLCGDLFTQGGSNPPPLTESDILEPSEGLRKELDYYSHTRNAREIFDRLAATQPTTMACMHGSTWQGDGEKLIQALAARLV